MLFPHTFVRKFLRIAMTSNVMHSKFIAKYIYLLQTFIAHNRTMLPTIKMSNRKFISSHDCQNPKILLCQHHKSVVTVVDYNNKNPDKI